MARPPAERFRALTSAIGGVCLFSSRHATLTLILVLVAAAVAGNGVRHLQTNVDVADVLPRGDYNTTAAHALTKDFKSAFTLQITLQFHTDSTPGHAFWTKDNRERIPNRATTAHPDNITDEVYVRAIAQMIDFMKEHDKLICCSIAISDLYKLINWTVAGGQGAPDAAYHLPPTTRQGELQYRSVNDGAQQAILSAIDALASPTWHGTAVLLTPNADTEASTAEIGERAIAARDAYIRWVDENPGEAYQVFSGDNFPRLTVELPVANAHSSALTKADFSRLLPLVAAFILITLFVAFRNVGAVIIAFSSLAIGVVTTYGVEGYLGIALNPLNLTLMPLIMGVGIDYSIHTVNEFLHYKKEGLANELAFREVGRRSGLALFIGTATTIMGLAVMVASPSLLIAQFGALAAIAMGTIYLLALTFIPAALTVWPGTRTMGQRSSTESWIVPRLARMVSKVRVLVVIGVLVVSGIATVASFRLTNEAFGDPGRNYLQNDPVRQEHEQGLKWFYDVAEPDVKANVITFQGDLTNPGAHAYMREIEKQLKAKDRVISDTLRTLPFLMETWLTVKDGGSGALAYLAQGRAGSPPYPATRDDIKRELDALYASPVKELGSIFTNGPRGHYTLGVMTFSVKAATYDEAKVVWTQVWDAVNAAERLKPSDVKVAFVGNTATNYLFVAKEVPWVLYMGTFATIGLMLIVIPFFRSFKAVAAVGIVSFATTAWWLGILPSLGIGMAITLVIPTIFIISLGTDYSVHLIWSILKVGDTREVFASTGKSILFSWVTTIGPFLIFMGIQDLSVRKTMIATALAITIIFVVTMLTIPSFYKVGPRKPRPETPATGVPSFEAETNPAPASAVE